MSTIADELRKSGLVQITPGEIWSVRDDLVIFPEERQGQERTKHPRRLVLVLSNEWICTSYACPCVQVAPLSHLTDFKSEAETEIERSNENGLQQKSRVLLGHSQPLLKTDLKAKIGKLSLTDWETVQKKIYWNFE
jgi:mRNA-degrading endonuclease toxin of MazEF toxin-antitoxin module